MDIEIILFLLFAFTIGYFVGYGACINDFIKEDIKKIKK